MYHQVLIHPLYASKTTFIADWGVFAYQKMSFGFKNTRVTYQRLVDQVFRQQIGRNVEIYVDDIVIKSRQMIDFADDLEETLATLRDVWLKLSPT